MSIFDELKKIDFTLRELKKFGVFFGFFLLVISGIFWWRFGSYNFYLGGFGILFIFWALILPGTLRVFYKIWMSFALIIKTIITFLILAILFYLVITPFSFLGRIFGQRFLEEKNGKASSYWFDRIEKHSENYERQF
ncbi:hypothetical protein HYW53_00565 [Candidatus Giovannonibacteria bacterium]|nr:hypothetical protein [Candidatus Giovannonibacteria bacterium]